MISWIQKYFQQHFRIIFGVLLGIVIISFVFVYNPSGGMGRADQPLIERRFFHYNLGDAADQRSLFGDAQLSANLQMGFFGGLDSAQIENYAYQRGAALHLANEWGIPPASEAELVEAIKELRMFQGQDGQFDAKAYATFQDNLKTDPTGITAADIKRVLSDDVRMEKVSKLLSGPGYVLPSEVSNQLLRTETSWTISTATADYAAFKPDLKPTDAELAKFFEESSFRYQVPPRVVASYVEFPTTAHLNEVNVTDAEVRAFYDQNPARFPKPTTNPATPGNPTPDTANPEADFALVRPQVEAALKLDRAQKLALKTASDFAVALYNAKLPNDATLETFIAARGHTLKPLAPFTRETGPSELGGSREIATEAFKLNASRFISDPLATPSGAAVLFWKETLPPRTPLFNEVRERVVVDYTENEKRKRFIELGNAAKRELDARLAAGDTFEKAVEAASRATGLKLDTKTFAPFTLRNPPQDLDYSAANALERLEKGKVSDMIATQDKGIFVYAADRQAPDLTDANPRYVETRTQLAARNGNMAASAYLAEIVAKERARYEPQPAGE